MRGKLSSWRTSNQNHAEASTSKSENALRKSKPVLITRFSLGLGKAREHAAQPSSSPSSPLREAYASFSSFQFTGSQGDHISTDTSQNVLFNAHGGRTRSPEGQPDTNTNSKLKTETESSTPSYDITLPHPLANKSSSTSNVSVKMTSPFGSQPVVRSKTASAWENQNRRFVTINSRLPFSIVPPIATNFGQHIATTSPISQSGSRSATPTRGAATFTKLPDIRNSILDEVEGSLTATLKEFQELQGSWQNDSPPATPDQVSGPLPLRFYQHLDNTNSHSATWGHSHMGGPILQHPPALPGNFPNTYDSAYQTYATSGPFIPDQEYDDKLRSLQEAYDEQRKASHAIQLESGQVRRQLEFLKDRLSEFENEKHSLQQTVRDAEEKLHLTIAKLREAKADEIAAQKEISAARDTIATLEAKSEVDMRKLRLVQRELEGEREVVNKTQAKLEEANTHKVDLLERELENRLEIVVTKKKLKKAVDELNSIKRKARSTPTDTPVSPMDTRHLVHDLQFQLAEANRKNAALHERLQSLASNANRVVHGMPVKLPALQTDRLCPPSPTFSPVNSSSLSPAPSLFFASMPRTPSPSSPEQQRATTSSSSNSDTQFDELATLKANLAASERSRRDVVAERDRLGQLLRAEMRRVAIEENGRRHPSEGFVNAKAELREAVEVVRKRAQGWVAETKNDGQLHDKESIEGLNGEIEYYLNDIVLYKLDVKGYKKDLRKAEKKIRELSDGTHDCISMPRGRI